nr:hypothetical protein [Streptomyces sp. CBG31]
MEQQDPVALRHARAPEQDGDTAGGLVQLPVGGLLVGRRVGRIGGEPDRGPVPVCGGASAQQATRLSRSGI